MYPEAGGCLNGTAIAKRRIMILSLSASPSFLSLASIKYQASQPMTKHKKKHRKPTTNPNDDDDDATQPAVSQSTE
jgi:hypothetical protein